MSLFDRWYRQPNVAILKANEAIVMADEMTVAVRKANGTTDTIMVIITDILRYRDNIPFVTTVYEAVQEVKPPPTS